MSNFARIDLSAEAMRVAVNLEQRHDAWVAAVRRSDALPSSMFFAKKSGAEYLTIKLRDGRSTTLGARSAETEKRLSGFEGERAAAERALSETGKALAEIIGQSKVLKLPVVPSKAARILRELDIAGVLGNDVMLVGTNAFYAYEVAAGCLFMSGIEETEDFDLSWCRGARVSLAGTRERPIGSPVMKALKAVDPSFSINKSKPYQALDSKGYEVELIVATSLFGTLSRDEVFSPMAVFPEQEWLLLGRPVRSVAISVDNKACPIYAPDPRYMALLKLWLSEKPERDPKKKPKDKKQGMRLLSVVADKLAATYPMDTEFVLSLPEELLGHFNAWAKDANYNPGNTGMNMR